MQAVSHCVDCEPIPGASIGDEQIWVRADRERLLMALYHGIRSTQDTTSPDGEVAGELELKGANRTIRNIDTDTGMDELFVRERRFKPFDTTKGTQGMGHCCLSDR